MISFLGCHWMRYHPDDRDMTHVKAMQYSSFTLFEQQWANRDFCNELLAHAPDDAIFLLRHHGRSEQKAQMYADPARMGREHAEEWDKDTSRIFLPLDRCYMCGINEPDTNHAQEATNTYELERLRHMNATGLQAGMYCFGTGHPSTVDLRPENKPDWSWYETSHAELLRGNHIAVVHEYGLPGNYMWGDNCNRLQYCPWDDVRFVIQECGIDGGTGDRPQEGWQAFGLSAEVYGSWLQGYFDVMAQDARIHSVQPFTYDYAHPWSSFDIRPMRDVLERRWEGGKGINRVAKPQPKPPPVPPPPSLTGIIDPIVAQAILNIEAGGDGYNKDGSLKIRFEAHIFRYLFGNVRFADYFKISDSRPFANPQYYRHSPGDPWQEIHTGNQAHEYTALALAAKLNEEHAYSSISMGVAQVMGFNHERIGYATAKTMYDAFSASEAAQVVGFFNYVLSDVLLGTAVRAKDWRTIARLYNGAGNVDTYSMLLENEYNRLVSSDE